MEATILEIEVLPLLVQSFDQVTSLSLAWEGAYISKHALEQIGTLQSLRQLHLSVGRFTGIKHVWFVDHDEIRSWLRTLKHLHYLALSLDTYGNPSEHPDYYLSKRIVPRNMDESTIWTDVMALPNSAFVKRSKLSFIDDDHASAEEEYYSEHDDTTRARIMVAFDKIHKMRMTNEATKYARAFPKLQWIYVGKLQFAVKEVRGVRQAFSLVEQRDDPSGCFMLLRGMFGMPR